MVEGRVRRTDKKVVLNDVSLVSLPLTSDIKHLYYLNLILVIVVVVMISV